MAKNSMKQIERDEKKVIEELSRNANKSINEIAKSCGFSRQKVWRIIKNLENNNTIWGYVAVTNDEKLNKKNYMVLIKRANTPLKKELLEKIVNREIEINTTEDTEVDIISSNYMNGAYDWVICINAPDIRHVKRFCENLNRTFEGWIAEIQLIEKIFSVKKCGIQNPEIENLNDFFQV
jgi:DNA-binding Lrp family transcriptional regulator